MSGEDRAAGSSRGGLFQSIRTLTATLLGLIRNRLELFSTEFEEERIRLVSMLVWTLVGLFSAFFGCVFLILLIAVALWKDHPLLALGIPAALFIGATIVSVMIVRGKARAKPRLFGASLTELRRDIERLTTRS